MKYVCVYLLFIASPAWASQKLNFLSCYYDHMKVGWQVLGALYSDSSYDLAEGESRNLNGAWTSEKPKGPEFAICNMAIGTGDDDTVVITSYKFEAKAFKPFAGKSCEDFEGTDIKLVSQDKITLNRSDYSEMLTDDWLPPEPDRFSIRTYFPKTEELDQLPQIWESKCLELIP
jgi:hypothetical protein